MGTRKQKELELYEVLILFDPNLIENEVANKIQFYQEFLVNKGSKVMVQNQGRRGLTYAIKKAESASFVQIVFFSRMNQAASVQLALEGWTAGAMNVHFLMNKVPLPKQ